MKIDTKARNASPGAASFQPKLITVSSAPEDKIYLDQARSTNSRLTIQGWIFNPAEAVTGAEVVIHSRGSRRRFALKTGLSRDDVGEVFSCENAYHSGFEGSFPLDQATDALSHVELVFQFGSDSREAGYRIEWEREPHRIASILGHTLRQLSLGDLKWAAGELLRGRIRTIWREMHKSYHGEPIHESTEVNLDYAINLLHEGDPGIAGLRGPVDIVIPVYNGLHHLDPLFESLGRNTDEQNRIILVDDCSPDPAVRVRLREFAKSRNNVTLVELAENLGFVGAANRGAEIATNDFVLLNTDVVVPPLWLERLFAPMHSDPAVASVTPFSNAATICSFPVTCADNEVFNDRPVEAIDRYFRAVKTELIDSGLPTGVGFCMAVRMATWREIGPFDRAAFKQGYGEENDWCQRAAARGYKNIIGTNLYAYHRHGGSFEPASRAEYRARGYAEVLRRHPNYARDVAQYIEKDVLRPLREVLTVIVASGTSTPGCHLILDHRLGGGSNHYRKKVVTDLVQSGHPVMLVLIRSSHELKMHPERYRLQFYYKSLTCSFRFDDLNSLSRLLAFFSIDQIFVNDIVSDEQPLALVRWIVDTKRKTGAELVVPFHDFYALCPSYTLIGADGKYCGLPSETTCASCLSSNTFAFNPTSETISSWRDQWGELIRVSDRVLCFSQNSYDLVAKIYPADASRFVILPHDHAATFDRRPQYKLPAGMRLGVVGSIGYQKGSDVLDRLAKTMQHRQSDASIVVIGALDNSNPEPNVKVTGAYQPSELSEIIERETPTLFLLPSIWPETFSYVTQELINLDVPLVVFDVGAPEERVRQYSKGKVISLALADDPDALFDMLIGIDQEFRRAPQ